MLLIWISTPLAILGAAYVYIFGSNLDEALSEEWLVILVQLLLYTGPYVALWATGNRTLLIWILQTAQTALLWTWLIYLVDKSRAEQTGAAIGAGLIMLVAPFIITILSLVIAKLVEAKITKLQ